MCNGQPIPVHFEVCRPATWCSEIIFLVLSRQRAHYAGNSRTLKAVETNSSCHSGEVISFRDHHGLDCVFDGSLAFESLAASWEELASAKRGLVGSLCLISCSARSEGNKMRLSAMVVCDNSRPSLSGFRDYAIFRHWHQVQVRISRHLASAHALLLQNFFHIPQMIKPGSYACTTR